MTNDYTLLDILKEERTVSGVVCVGPIGYSRGRNPSYFGKDGSESVLYHDGVRIQILKVAKDISIRYRGRVPPLDRESLLKNWLNTLGFENTRPSDHFYNVINIGHLPEDETRELLRDVHELSTF